MKKYYYWILGIILCIITSVGYIFYIHNQVKLYSKNFFYMDTIIQVKIYSNNKNKVDKAFQEINNIYSTYHKLSDKYNGYDNIINVYTINNNLTDSEYLEIDERLYRLLEYGLEWKEIKNGKLDINMGCVIDIWKKYFDSADGIPDDSEFNLCNSNPIILLENNKILNNHPNIDLGAISKGYTTQVVGDYLDKIGLSHYLINAGGNVLTGGHYQNKTYKIGIENPNDKSVYKILNVTDKAVVTSGGYERFYEYEGIKYNHIIDPNTKYPANYMKSVTVISDDSALADALTTLLFLMPVEEGEHFIKDFPVEVIWYTNENEIITTDGVNAYESK